MGFFLVDLFNIQNVSLMILVYSDPRAVLSKSEDDVLPSEYGLSSKEFSYLKGSQ